MKRWLTSNYASRQRASLEAILVRTYRDDGVAGGECVGGKPCIASSQSLHHVHTRVLKFRVAPTRHACCFISIAPINIFECVGGEVSRRRVIWVFVVQPVAVRAHARRLAPTPLLSSCFFPLTICPLPTINNHPTSQHYFWPMSAPIMMDSLGLGANRSAQAVLAKEGANMTRSATFFFFFLFHCVVRGFSYDFFRTRVQPHSSRWLGSDLMPFIMTQCAKKITRLSACVSVPCIVVIVHWFIRHSLNVDRYSLDLLVACCWFLNWRKCMSMFTVEARFSASSACRWVCQEFDWEGFSAPFSCSLFFVDFNPWITQK